jgi:hypothetical protein
MPLVAGRGRGTLVPTLEVLPQPIEPVLLNILPEKGGEGGEVGICSTGDPLFRPKNVDFLKN